MTSRRDTLPCPRCGAPVRVTIQGADITDWPAHCPERCMTYHGNEEWDVTDPTYAEEPTTDPRD